jgi:glycosyltransferase involved in cell wall biosynthesis
MGPHAARLVPRRAPEQLAQALGAVLGDPDLRRRMSEAARLRALGRGSAAAMVDAYADIYVSLIGGSPPRRTVSP